MLEKVIDRLFGPMPTKRYRPYSRKTPHCLYRIDRHCKPSPKCTKPAVKARLDSGIGLESPNHQKGQSGLTDLLASQNPDFRLDHLFGAGTTPTFINCTCTAGSRQNSAGATFFVPFCAPTGTNNFRYIAFSWDLTPTVTSVQTIDPSGVVIDTATVLVSGTSGNNQKYAIYGVFGCQSGATAYKIILSATSLNWSACTGEHYNCATSSSVDGTATFANQINGTTAFQSGAVTTTVDGDLILQFCFQDAAIGYNGTLFTNNAGFDFFCTELGDGLSGQFGVQTTHGAINPTITYNPGVAGASVTIAIKPANAGTPPPSGIRIQRMQCTTAPANVTSYNVQFPGTGNVFALGSSGYNGTANTHCRITAIADTGSNGWNVAVTASVTTNNGNPATNPYFDVQWSYTYTTTTSNTLKLTITVDNPTFNSVNTADVGVILYDIITPVSNSFDGVASATGVQSVPVVFFDTVRADPNSVNGLILCMENQDIGTCNGLQGADSTHCFDAPYYSEENGGFNPLFRDAAAAHVIHTTSDPYTFSFSNTSSNSFGSVGAWAAAAICFQDSPPPSIHEQEGFLFRADDGSESGASPLDSQDTNISRAKLASTRLRVLTNLTNDPVNEGLKLQYRRIGDEQWRDV